MKRISTAVLLIALLLACYGAAFAAGGTVSDPLVSKKYLDDTFGPALAAQAQEAAQKSAQGVYQTVLGGLAEQQAVVEARLRLLEEGYSYHAAFADFRAKRGDSVTGITGSGILLLAGQAQLGYTGAGVVDVSTGALVSPGAGLEAGHRYLVAEDTVAILTVTSPTAVVSTDGYFFHAESVQTDYNALADALKTLGLFRGSDTPYGSGYALEENPTRIQGLVMFLRLIGEEGAALSYTGQNPFRDADPWCDRYLAYAFAKGYTNGTNLPAGEFTPQAPIPAAQYMTFLLRALGYSDAGAAPDFSWNTAEAAARQLGILSPGEEALLQKESFDRAKMVYLSYFGLDANMKTGGSLLERLIANGVFSRDAAQAARGALGMERIA